MAISRGTASWIIALLIIALTIGGLWTWHWREQRLRRRGLDLWMRWMDRRRAVLEAGSRDRRLAEERLLDAERELREFQREHPKHAREPGL